MRIKIRVTPRAKKNTVKYKDGLLRVHITAPPVDGKANQTLLDFLTDEFNLKKTNLRIVSGQAARDKIIEISNPSDTLQKFLGQQKCL